MSARSRSLAATGGSALDPCAIRRNAISSSEERGVSADFIAPSVTFECERERGTLDQRRCLSAAGARDYEPTMKLLRPSRSLAARAKLRIVRPLPLSRRDACPSVQCTRAEFLSIRATGAFLTH